MVSGSERGAGLELGVARTLDGPLGRGLHFMIKNYYGLRDNYRVGSIGVTIEDLVKHVIVLRFDLLDELFDLCRVRRGNVVEIDLVLLEQGRLQILQVFVIEDVGPGLPDNLHVVDDSLVVLAFVLPEDTEEEFTQVFLCKAVEDFVVLEEVVQ